MKLDTVCAKSTTDDILADYALAHNAAHTTHAHSTFAPINLQYMGKPLPEFDTKDVVSRRQDVASPLRGPLSVYIDKFLMRKKTKGPFISSAWLVFGRGFCFAIAGDRVEVAQVPPQAASAFPVSDFAATLALAAFAHLVKVL